MSPSPRPTPQRPQPFRDGPPRLMDGKQEHMDPGVCNTCSIPEQLLPSFLDGVFFSFTETDACRGCKVFARDRDWVRLVKSCVVVTSRPHRPHPCLAHT